MIVTTIPILVPALKAAEIDLVWFGVIIVILMEAALISPPEGINLYVITWHSENRHGRGE